MGVGDGVAVGSGVAAGAAVEGFAWAEGLSDSGRSRARYCSTISSTVSSLRIMEISMRRFWAWPAVLSLEATGLVSP